GGVLRPALRLRAGCQAGAHARQRGGADAALKGVGAGSGNRTRIASLEGWCFTTKLYPRAVCANCRQASPASTVCRRLLFRRGVFGTFRTGRSNADRHAAVPGTALFVGAPIGQGIGRDRALLAKRDDRDPVLTNTVLDQPLGDGLG